MQPMRRTRYYKQQEGSKRKSSLVTNGTGLETDLHWLIMRRKIQFQLLKVHQSSLISIQPQRNLALTPQRPNLKSKASRKPRNEPTFKELSIASKYATKINRKKEKMTIPQFLVTQMIWITRCLKTTTPLLSTSWRSSGNQKARKSRKTGSQAKTLSPLYQRKQKISHTNKVSSTMIAIQFYIFLLLSHFKMVYSHQQIPLIRFRNKTKMEMKLRMMRCSK